MESNIHILLQATVGTNKIYNWGPIKVDFLSELELIKSLK